MEISVLIDTLVFSTSDWVEILSADSGLANKTKQHSHEQRFLQLLPMLCVGPSGNCLTDKCKKHQSSHLHHLHWVWTICYFFSSNSPDIHCFWVSIFCLSAKPSAHCSNMWIRKLPLHLKTSVRFVSHVGWFHFHVQVSRKIHSCIL